MITIEQAVNIFYLVSLTSMIDLSLTYYILWFDRKHNPKTPRFKELNPLARFIMNKTNYGPWGLLIGGLVTQTIIWIFGIGLTAADPLQAVELGNFFFGAMFVAIWIHIYSIKQLVRNQKARALVEYV